MPCDEPRTVGISASPFVRSVRVLLPAAYAVHVWALGEHGNLCPGMAIDFSLSDDALDGDCLVVAVRGDLDLFTAPDLKQRLTEAIDAGTTRLVVDLDEATSIDSTTLGVL